MLSTTLSIQGMQTKNSFCPPEMGGLWVGLPKAYKGVSDNLHTNKETVGIGYFLFPKLMLALMHNILLTFGNKKMFSDSHTNILIRYLALPLRFIPLLVPE